MRRLVFAGLVGLAGGVHAQDRVAVPGPGATYPVPGRTVRTVQPLPGRPAPPPVSVPGPARPVRGQVIPADVAARDYVPDWASYGLPQPPVGYNWVRYGPDAVLVDARGAVYDVEPGVDWSRYGGPAYAAASGYAPPPAVRTYTVPAGRTQTVFVGPGVTTVTVTTQPALATTTTRTEYLDETVTYSQAPRPAPRAKLVRRGKLLRR